MSATAYRFSNGNLLVQPNHYRYVAYQGKVLLLDYEEDRANAVAYLSKSVLPEGPELLALLHTLEKRSIAKVESLASITPSYFICNNTDSLLLEETVRTGTGKTSGVCTALLRVFSVEKSPSPLFLNLADRLRRNIEVSRLVYSDYERNFRRPLGNPLQIENYVLAGAVMSILQKSDMDLHFFNALLKVNDTVIAHMNDIIEPFYRWLACLSIATESVKYKFLKKQLEIS